MKYLNTQKNRGFTLLETLVAIFILMIALNSLLTLTTDSLFSSNYAKNESTAVYLAQEAMDYIRNDKDTTASVNGNADWGSFLNHYRESSTDPNTKCYSENGCMIDAMDWDFTQSVRECGSIAPWGDVTCDVFSYHDDATMEEYYDYDLAGGTPSNFKRQIKMKLTGGGGGVDELQVTVIVEWRNGTLVKSYVLRSSLLNWL